MAYIMFDDNQVVITGKIGWKMQHKPENKRKMIKIL